MIVPHFTSNGGWTNNGTIKIKPNCSSTSFKHLIRVQKFADKVHEVEERKWKQKSVIGANKRLDKEEI